MTLINNQIRYPQVRVVDQNGEQLGIMNSRDANLIAQNRGLDLVLFAEQANPPVCKIIDYNKFLFDQKKQEKEVAKKNRQSQVEVKEIRLRPGTELHDLKIKAEKAQEFLNDGNKVRISMKFEGREINYVDKGRKVIDSFIGLLTNTKIENKPQLFGQYLNALLKPDK